MHLPNEQLLTQSSVTTRRTHIPRVFQMEKKLAEHILILSGGNPMLNVAAHEREMSTSQSVSHIAKRPRVLTTVSDLSLLGPQARHSPIRYPVCCRPSNVPPPPPQLPQGFILLFPLETPRPRNPMAAFRFAHHPIAHVSLFERHPLAHSPFLRRQE